MPPELKVRAVEPDLKWAQCDTESHGGVTIRGALRRRFCSIGGAYWCGLWIRRFAGSVAARERRTRHLRPCMRPVTVALVAALIWVPALGAQEGATVKGLLRLGRTTGPSPVVYLLSAEGSPLESTPERAVIDQRNMRFTPMVLTTAVGSTVEFLNSDRLMHNVFSPRGSGPGFDLGTYQQGDRRDHTFRELGEHVILCHIHPEMVAYVVVVPTKHHTTVDEDGRFEFRDVPAGTYQLNVWRRRFPTSQRALTLSAGAVAEVVVSLGPSGGG